MTFHLSDLSHLSPREAWQERARELDSLWNTDEPVITGLANAAAFIDAQLGSINWAGFYLFDGQRLILGPFIGKPACTTITMGKGVCGTAAARRETVVVEDVEQFPGHIACDAASQSEVVVPLIGAHGRLYGVLDIDSPERSRFDRETVEGLEQLARIVVSKLEAADVKTLFV